MTVDPILAVSDGSGRRRTAGDGFWLVGTSWVDDLVTWWGGVRNVKGTSQCESGLVLTVATLSHGKTLPHWTQMFVWSSLFTGGGPVVN